MKSLRELAEEILALPIRWQRAEALECIPEPMRSHVRDMVTVELARREWAAGEA